MATPTITPKPRTLRQRAQSTWVGSLALSWDFLGAVLVGTAAGAAPAQSHLVGKSCLPVLLGLGAAATTLAALTLTGTTLLINALTPAYRDLLSQLPHGELEIITPFLQVVRIGAVGAVLSFTGALIWPLVRFHEGWAWLVMSVCAVSVLWALLGFVQTVGRQLPKHMRDASEASRLADRRRAAQRPA